MIFLQESRRSRRGPGAVLIFAAVILSALTAGCDGGGETAAQRVVIYTSVDQRFAQAVLERFEQRTGINVEALYDTEAGKTTGFLRHLAREAERPRCDVWWSSEVFGTIELARAGLLEPCASPAAADIPPAWKDPEGRWTGTAARARVIAFDTRVIRPAEVPKTWRALAASSSMSRFAIANPLFGTTRGHVAALFAYWGEPDGRNFLQKLRDDGATVADGNSQAVRLVASGAVDTCMTDTDDVWVAQRRGDPIELAYPRITDDGPIIWIPCTVARVRGGPNPDAARRLIDFLVGVEVERELARSDSRNVPLRESLRTELGIGPPWPEPLDFGRVADALPAATQAARDILLR